jgi:hypothetical protein
MLTELRKVIPSFLRRVDLPDRGGAWSSYLAVGNSAMAELTERLGLIDQAGTGGAEQASVSLNDFDPDAEVKLVAAALYPHSNLSDIALLDRARRMTATERVEVLRTYVGDRQNRRHKPGRAFERCDYRFDVLADYGAFRDLQRHRMLTVEWQPLSPRHGYDVPEAVELAGERSAYEDALARSADLHDALAGPFPAQAPYAVCLAYRLRFVLQLNAREAMHLIELRSGPQGHPSYRHVAQEMYRLIDEQAGHHAVAEAMRFVDLEGEPALGRLDAERRAEAKRTSG